MGNALAVLIGLVCGILGIVGLAVWWQQFVMVFKGCIGVTLLCGGLLALLIGISEMRAAKEFESAVPAETEEPESGEEEAADDAEPESAEESDEESSDDEDEESEDSEE